MRRRAASPDKPSVAARKRDRPDRAIAGAALAVCLLPFPALAQAQDTACARLRPGWDDTPATPLTEVLALAGTPLALALMIGTALAVRLRSAWGGLVAVVGWSFYIYFLVFQGDAAGLRDLAMAEGCIGSPTLFIVVVAAICVATVLYTAPSDRRTSDQEK
jgi:hypothetical protein